MENKLFVSILISDLKYIIWLPSKYQMSEF